MIATVIFAYLMDHDTVDAVICWVPVIMGIVYFVEADGNLSRFIMSSEKAF